ncbi:hypothetical protein AGMMS49941_12590 [Deferribacterales bacterium]|nr:hypothetical protein AGMMS49941_12590 [Deferribacterales bacterium]
MRLLENTIHDGFNTFGIFGKNHAWNRFVINFTGRAGLSMELERAYFSQYPVLPDSFITPFIILSVLSVFAVFLLLYVNGFSWLIGHSWALFAVIVAVQVLVILFYAGQKNDLSYDEVATYYRANNSAVNNSPSAVNPLHADRDAGNANWRSHKELFEAMTAQPDERLSHFNKLRTRTSVHSQLHYMQLHLLSLLFPNTFSVYLGVAINIMWFVGVCIVVYAISKRFLAGKLALLPLVFWGFSGAAVSMGTYIRAYSMAVFFYTLLVYIALIMLTKPRLSLRFCAVLALTFFFGFDAHNYFIFWFAGVALIPIVYMLWQRRYTGIAKCAVSLAFAIAGYYIFNPAFLSALRTFSGNSLVNGISGILEYFVGYVRLLNAELFGGVPLYIVLVILVLLVARFIRERFVFRCAGFTDENTLIKFHVEKKQLPSGSHWDIKLDKNYMLLAVAVVFYIVAISRYVNVLGRIDYYLWGVAPVLVILLLSLLKGVINNAKVFVCIALLFTLVGEQGKILTRFGRTNYPAIAETYSDVPQAFSSAVQALTADSTLQNVRISSLYTSESLLNDGQPNYTNMVIVADTELQPSELLGRLKVEEQRAGRVDTGRWGARPLDIDIIDYAGQPINTDELTIPHSQMTKRPFVLIPLAELLPDYKHPVSGQNVGQMMSKI